MSLPNYNPDELARQEREVQEKIDKFSSLALEPTVPDTGGDAGGDDNDDDLDMAALEHSDNDDTMLKMFEGGGDDDDAILKSFNRAEAGDDHGGAEMNDAMLVRLEKEIAAEDEAENAIINGTAGKKPAAAASKPAATAAPPRPAAAKPAPAAPPHSSVAKPASASAPASAPKPSTATATAMTATKHTGPPVPPVRIADGGSKLATAAPASSAAAAAAAASASAFAELSARLTGNIASLSAHIKALLVQKQLAETAAKSGKSSAAPAPAAGSFEAEASRALALRRSLEHALARVAQLQRAAAGPAPGWSLRSVPLQREVALEEVAADTVEVCVDCFAPARRDSSGGDTLTAHVALDLGAGAPPEVHTGWAKQDTAGNARWAATLPVALPANWARSTAVTRALRALRARVVLKKKGVLWGTKDLGAGDWRVGAALTTACEAAEAVKVRDTDDQVLGTVALRLRVRRPLARRLFVTEAVLIATVEFDDEVELAPAAAKSVAAAAAARTPRQAVSTAELLGSAPAASAGTGTGVGAAAAAKSTPAPAEAAAAAKEAEGELEGDALLRAAGAPAGVTWAELEVAGTPQATPSFDALNAIKAAAEAAGKAAATAGRTREAAAQQEIVGECDRMVMFFEVAVGSGKLSLDDYLDALKAAVARERKHMQTLVALAKFYHGRGDSAKFKEFGAKAKALAGTVQIMEQEIKTAEENRDELDQE